jgi:hypothetical protein
MQVNAPMASRKPVVFAVKKIPLPWWWSICIGQGIGSETTYVPSKAFTLNY